jgi:hypothetical protein
MATSLVLLLLAATRAGRFLNCHSRVFCAAIRIDPDQKVDVFVDQLVALHCGQKVAGGVAVRHRITAAILKKYGVDVARATFSRRFSQKKLRGRTRNQRNQGETTESAPPT